MESDADLKDLDRDHETRFLHPRAPSESPIITLPSILLARETHHGGLYSEYVHGTAPQELNSEAVDFAEQEIQFPVPSPIRDIQWSLMPPSVPPKDAQVSPASSTRAMKSPVWPVRADQESRQSPERPFLDAPMFYRRDSPTSSPASDLMVQPFQYAPGEESIAKEEGSNKSTVIAAGEQARRNRSFTLGRANDANAIYGINYSRTVASPRDAYMEDAHKGRKRSEHANLLTHDVEPAFQERVRVCDNLRKIESGDMEIEMPPVVRRLSAVYSGKARSISIERPDLRHIPLDAGMDSGLNPRLNSRASLIKRNSSPFPFSLGPDPNDATVRPSHLAQHSALCSHPPRLEEIPRRATTIPRRRHSSFVASPEGMNLAKMLREEGLVSTAPLEDNQESPRNSWITSKERLGQGILSDPYSLMGEERTEDGEQLDIRESSAPPESHSKLLTINVILRNAARGTRRDTRATIAIPNPSPTSADYDDDEKLSRTIWKAYTGMRGRGKAIFLARCVIGVRLLQQSASSVNSVVSHHTPKQKDLANRASFVATSSNSSINSKDLISSSETHLLALLLSPRKGRDSRNVTEQLARIITIINTKSTPLPPLAPRADTCHHDAVKGQEHNHNQDGHDDDDDHESQRTGLSIQLLEGWSATRILLATLCVVCLSLAATLLWIFAGAAQEEASFGPINLLGAGGAQSGSGGGGAGGAGGGGGGTKGCFSSSFHRAGDGPGGQGADGPGAGALGAGAGLDGAGGVVGAQLARDVKIVRMVVMMWKW